MDNEDVRAQILSVISNLIKGDADGAQENIHNALQAKMQSRVAPEDAAPASVETIEDPEVTPAE